MAEIFSSMDSLGIFSRIFLVVNSC